MPRPLSRTVTASSLAQVHLDPRGVAGDRFVDGVVQQLGDEMVHRPLVGAADVHGGPAPHRFEPLQDLDVLGGVRRGRDVRGRYVEQVAGRGSSFRQNAALP